MSKCSAVKPEENLVKKPEWLRVLAPTSSGYEETNRLVKMHNLNTVCHSAACPNIGECWSKKLATFMILGDICTRSCRFCNIKTGMPGAVDLNEPLRLAEAVFKLGLRHVVITSVDRDDLPDGGANHFKDCIQAIRDLGIGTIIEILTPDFLRKPQAIPIIIKAKPDIFNHNIETVPSLYKKIRVGARYYNSLRLLEQVKNSDPSIFTKSGLMVGLGESKYEIIQVMDDLREAKVDFITIGQYLQPTPRHTPLVRYYSPEEFSDLAKIAKSKGFKLVASSPLTRSSYYAEDFFNVYKTKV